ncbi:MAG: helix-turn-helix domain-containing protein [Myxococcota bacterium]
MSDADALAANLARNLRHHREMRRYTQQRLSDVSGVPRPTISMLESGSANPTLAVLARVARALQIPLEELLGPPRHFGQHYAVTDLATREKRGILFRDVLPDGLPGITLERVAFPPRGRVTGIPHTKGSREYLIVERGVVVLRTEHQQWTVHAGEVVIYRGDQSHGYHNPSDEEAVAYTMIVPG